MSAVDVDSPPDSVRSASDRWSIIVFAAAIVVGFVALVSEISRYYWFNGDDWQFLANRDGGDLRQLVEPHNEHLVSVPILAFRGMFRLWGLESYRPYQLPVIVLHLTAVVLLWLIIRRCQVNPWIATAAASVFILFGPGEENIIWAFQIGFTGSLVLGLAHLLLADHEGPISWRDGVGLALGFIGLFSSGFTPLITVVIGAVVLVRRGLRPAVFNTVPLGLVYGVWYLTIGPEIIEDPYGRGTDLAEMVGFMKTALVATFEGIGGNPVMATIYAVVLVVGLVLAYTPLPVATPSEPPCFPSGCCSPGWPSSCSAPMGAGGSDPRWDHRAGTYIWPPPSPSLPWPSPSTPSPGGGNRPSRSPSSSWCR